MRNPKAIFIAGYEGETPDSFIKKLELSKVSLLIDVREIPLSRKNGFSKHNLEKTLSKKGIKYLHLKQLGSPYQLRSQLHKTGNYRYFFSNYRNYLRKHLGDLKYVLGATKDGTTCLMCLEKDYHVCHRTIIADQIQKLQPNLQVVPL